MNFFTKRIFKRHLDERIPFYPLQLLYILSKYPRTIRRIIVDCLDDFRVDVSILWMSISIFRTKPILPVLFMFIKPTISAWDFSLNSKLRINIWIGFKQTHVVESSRFFCLIPTETIQSVTRCPNNDIEWKERVAMKNCSAYANMCNGTYVYHCLIDTYMNKLVEVCAKPKIIHFGSCTEFSSSALRIIRNQNKSCFNFPRNPCPNTYNSTMAYKYKGCYELKTSRNEIQTTPFNASSEVTTTTKMYNQNGAFSVNDPTSASTRILCSLLSLLTFKIIRLWWCKEVMVVEQ